VVLGDSFESDSGDVHVQYRVGDGLAIGRGFPTLETRIGVSLDSLKGDRKSNVIG